MTFLSRALIHIHRLAVMVSSARYKAPHTNCFPPTAVQDLNTWSSVHSCFMADEIVGATSRPWTLRPLHRWGGRVTYG